MRARGCREALARADTASVAAASAGTPWHWTYRCTIRPVQAAAENSPAGRYQSWIGTESIANGRLDAGTAPARTPLNPCQAKTTSTVVASLASTASAASATDPTALAPPVGETAV